MPTIQQLVRKGRRDKIAKVKTAALVAAVYSGSSPPSGIRVKAAYRPGW